MIPYSSTLHVKPSTGSNGAAGTLANPLKTLNEALSIAYHRNIQVPITTQIDTIKVYAEDDPIAPDGFGGFEDCGWTESETPLICPSSRPPFPLRLVPDVDVIGIKHPVTNAKPIITIDETPPGGGITAYTDWLPSEPRCMIRAAVHASVSGFNIDGSQLADTTPGHSDWVAIHAEAPIGTTISDFGLLGCDIHDWLDGARYVSEQAQTLEATIRGSTFSGFGPIGLLEGHAGIWLEGSGEFDIDILGTTFVGSHDAVELAGESAVVFPTTYTTRGSVSFTSCHFHDNENGLEFVGEVADVTLSVDNSLFCRQYSKGGIGGTPVSASTGAILIQRSMGPPPVTNYEIDATILACDFRKNAWAIVFNPMSGSLFMGADGNPGLNNFCLDFSGFAPLQDPMRVQLYSKAPDLQVSASGNYWIRSNQLADSNGILTGLKDPGIAGGNLWSVDPTTGLPISPPRPPGPKWGEFIPGTIPSEAFGRNWSVDPDGIIHFGNQPAPLPAPDCNTNPCPIDNP